MKKANIKKWVKALRSGEYKQSKGALQDESGFCCLGVACKVFHPDYAKSASGFLREEMPTQENGASEWLVRVDDDFENKTHVALPVLNDDDNLTFDEIADCLEAVYIHEVLK